MRLLVKKIFLEEQGFTLVEIIISMLILSLFVVTYASTATVSFKEYKVAGKKTVALNYARQVLEETKLLALKPVVDNVEKPFSNPQYSYKIFVTPYDAAMSSKLYNVTVSVYYQENNIKKHVDLSTLAFWMR